AVVAVRAVRREPRGVGTAGQVLVGQDHHLAVVAAAGVAVDHGPARDADLHRWRRVRLRALVADVRPRAPLAVLVLHAQLEGVVLLRVAGDAGLAGPVGVLRRPVVDTDLRARDRGAVARGRVVPAERDGPPVRR